MESRSIWVDYAKAIGIILVVYGHVSRGLNNAGIELPTELFRLVDSIVYSFHMPLFFFLSGLFFHGSFSTKGGKKLIFSKVDTVLYPYLLWSIIQGSVEALLSKFTNGSTSFNDILSIIWSPIAQFWFLYVLFLSFVFASAIYSLFSERFTAIVFLLSAALYSYSSMLPQIYILKVIAENFAFFILGIVFSMYFNIGLLTSTKIFLGSALSFAIAQWIFHGYLSMRYTDRGLLSLALALISIFFVISTSALLSKKRYRLLAYIGSSSMAIYLMHILAGSGARIALHKILNPDYFVIHLLFGLFVGLLAPLIALLAINKLKIPYVFSAPISSLVENSYNKASRRIAR